MHEIAFPKFCPGGRDKRMVVSRDRNNHDFSGYVQLHDSSAVHLWRKLNVDKGYLSVPKGIPYVDINMCQYLKDSFSPPVGRGYCCQTQSLVNFCPSWVIKARYYARNMKDITSDSGGHDIGIIRLACCYECIHLFYFCLHSD